MKYLLISIQVIALSLIMHAGEQPTLKKNELEGYTKSSDHVFDANFKQITRTYLHKGLELKDKDLEEFYKLKNSDHENWIFTSYDKNGKVIPPEEFEVSNSDDPFAKPPAGHPVAHSFTVSIKGGKEFEYHDLEIKETVTLVITKSVKGTYENNKEYSFVFYRHSFDASCWHIAKLGDYRIPQRYFLTPKKDDPKHRINFRSYVLETEKS